MDYIFVPHGTQIDHSQHKETVCFLKFVQEAPQFPGGHKAKRIASNVFEADYLTAPDTRWEESPSYEYKIWYVIVK